jgi:hypothetical protein
MRKIGVLLVIALLLALVPAVLAGGWAVITLDEPPGEIRAGEPWTVGFTVLQHGQTPVHRLDPNSPVQPLLVAENPATGRRVEVEATPTKEVGHFVVEVTFPDEGEWTWTIFPNPLAGETLFEPLTVLPAAAASGASGAEAAPAIMPAAIQPEAAQPVVAQPETAQSSTPTAITGRFSVNAGLRWAALAALAAAVVLFIVQGRRRVAPQTQVES